MEALFVPIIAALATLLTVNLNASKADESDAKLQKSAVALGLTEEEEIIRKRRVKRVRSYAMRANRGSDDSFRVWGMVVSLVTALIFGALAAVEGIAKDGLPPYLILAAAGVFYLIIFFIAPFLYRPADRFNSWMRKIRKGNEDEEPDEGKDV